MTFEQFQQLVEQARTECRQKLEDTKAEFGLGTYDRYDLDLQQATIRFSDATGKARVEAKIQVAGTWTSDTRTWLWGWDIESLPEVSRNRMTEVRDFGMREKVTMVSESFAPCGEVEAWGMAALAGHLLKCQGFYRTPGKPSDTFLLLFSLTRKE
jgi:hypothetical protein